MSPVPVIVHRIAIIIVEIVTAYDLVRRTEASAEIRVRVVNSSVYDRYDDPEPFYIGAMRIGHGPYQVCPDLLDAFHLRRLHWEIGINLDGRICNG